MNLNNLLMQIEWRESIRQDLEREYAQNHPATDDLPELKMTCLVFSEYAAVFHGRAPLPGGQDWQGLVTITVTDDGDESRWPMTTHN